jgi:hypothetical protein
MTKLPKGVMFWDDESDSGNGIVVALRSGYRWTIDDHGMHVRGYATIKQARDEFKDIVPCCCKLCDDWNRIIK